MIGILRSSRIRYGRGIASGCRNNSNASRPFLVLIMGLANFNLAKPLSTAFASISSSSTNKMLTSP